MTAVALFLVLSPLSSPVATGVSTPDVTVPRTVSDVLGGREAVAPREPGWPWSQLSECEASGDWQANTGLFRGGLQFLTSTWLWMGGSDYAPEAHLATPEQQIAIAERLVAHERAEGRGGFNPWPACANKLGLPR